MVDTGCVRYMEVLWWMHGVLAARKDFDTWCIRCKKVLWWIHGVLATETDCGGYMVC